MYIKQVIISGFRSFRTQAETEPFSPRHNVIVGRNGSGKSNFFDAIQFVLLNQRFQSLRQEERQALLHEGAGVNVMSAFVEVIFDNADGRLATEGDEVVLRRTIGLKKDEFFLNRRRVTKQEVSSLLESAGFSKSNPYYIVQQGKVNALTMMQDSERLNLLKEVAGTKVYEERRTDSLRIISENSEKLGKIQEVIKSIESRLKELEGEKEELGQYQQKDRDKRALEYALFAKELKQSQQELEQLEERNVDTAKLHEDLREISDQIREKKKLLSKNSERVTRLEKEKAATDSERLALVEQHAGLELEVKEIKEKRSADSEAQVSLAAELTALNRRIADTEAEIQRTAGPAQKAAQKALDEAEAQLAEAKAAMEDLYSRQSRHSQFADADARDAALRKEIAAMKKAVNGKENAVLAVENQARGLEAQLTELRSSAETLEAEIRERHELATKLATDLADKVMDRNAAAEQQKELWRQLEEKQTEKTALRAQKEQARRDLKSSTPRQVADGLSFLEKYVRDKNIQGYHGPVIENFTLKMPEFAIPVEVAAGNQLFNVIVATDTIAAQLMEKLRRDKHGRVTFMPLNRMKPKDVTVPDSPDVSMLLDTTMEYSRDVAPAMKQLFGRKLLAKSLQAAATHSAKSNMDAITMEGDEVGRKGGISGGFRESSNRLTAMQSIKDTSAALEVIEREEAALTKKSNAVNQSVTNIMGELEKLAARAETTRRVVREESEKVIDIRRQIKETEAALSAKLEKLPRLRAEAAQESARAHQLEEEIGTPLEVGLSAPDKARLVELTGTIMPQRRRLVEQRLKERESASVHYQKLSALLHNNLLVKKEELTTRLDPAHGGTNMGSAAEDPDLEVTLELQQAELARVAESVKKNRNHLAQLEKALLEGRQSARALQDELETLRGNEADATERLADAGRTAERDLGRRTFLQSKCEAATKKIQALGGLPAAELQRFQNLRRTELMKRLHEANEFLKQYSHVNKKALDQYVSFSEQRETLMERKKELDASAVAIEKLIEALDRKKDEAIQNTFRSVSKFFGEVFRELVPNGKGQLIITQSADAPTPASDATDDEEDEEGAEESKSSGKGKGKKKQQPRALPVSQYTGVQVKVSFTGQGDAYLMSQLSGGQKALVALALIFAIQRCDPAPFYLFDEIDQALDMSYRSALASLIQRQAHSKDNPTQFITTTFRPELVSVASKAYGISHQNKVSSIEAMDREEALQFVAEILNEEEAVDRTVKQPKAKPRASVAPSASKKAPAPEPDAMDESEEEEAEGGDKEVASDDEEDEQPPSPVKASGKRRRSST